MSDISYKKFSDLAAASTLIAADVIPVVTTTGGNNSKKITYETFAQTVSSTLIGPFTTAITAVVPASADKWNSTYTTVQTNSATWGSGGSIVGLTIFNQISSITTPNNTTTVHALSIISSETNVDIAILSKGNGATLAQIPDDVATGGNKRGQYATDFQKARTNNAQVASGNYSVIGGGQNNSALGINSTIGGGSNNTSADYSTVNGGLSNTASGYISIIAGGSNNTASGNYSIIAGGRENITGGINGYSMIGGGRYNGASGDYSIVGGGYQNNALSSYSTIGGGRDNQASGNYATVPGGRRNYAVGEYSTVFGFGGVANFPGQLVHSAGYSSSYGDLQSSTFLLTKTTTSAVSSVCTLDNISSEITMSPNESLFITATIGCLSSSTDNSGYFGIIKAIAKCSVGTGAVNIYNQVEVSASRSVGTATTFNAGLSGTTDGKLRVVVYVNSTRTFRWNAKLETLSINGF